MLPHKFKFAVFFLIWIEDCVGVENESSFERNHVHTRIAGGFRPAVHILPKYIVSIRKRNEPLNKFGYTHFCAGSIITPDKILTAAHCVVDKYSKIRQASFFKIVAKTPIRLRKTEHSQEVYVKKVIVYHNFRKEALFNDIALLILEKNISLDGQLAAKAMLPLNDVHHGEVCTVIGWGRLYMHGPAANNILYADLTIKSTSYCRKRFPFLTSKKICATDVTDYGKDACTGDSGGPLLCNGILTGIVSYGHSCVGGYGSIFTNVYRYMDWIARGHSIILKSLKVLHFITLFLIVVS